MSLLEQKEMEELRIEEEYRLGLICSEDRFVELLMLQREFRELVEEKERLNDNRYSTAGLAD